MAGSIDGQPRLTLAGLEAAVRGADDGAVLVPEWLLQKIVAHDRGPAAAMFALPRLRAHAIGRDRLREVLERDELPWDATPPDGPTVVLLARPEADEFANTPAGALLLKYWRLLFHARVRSAVAAALDAAPLPRAAAQVRVEALGRP